MPGSPPPIRAHLAELPGYDPVVPLAERCRRVGIPVEQALKLDANENPFGAHPAVRAALIEAVGGSGLLSIYPDPQQVELRRALANHLAMPAEQIIAGAGADELLDLVMRAVVQPGQTVVTSTPTFGMYRFLADVNEIPLVEVARGAEFHIELEPLLEAAQSAGLLILTSPNNPTGDLFPQGALLELLESDATVLVDEAYVDFARESVIDLVDQYPRLIILRTFSKWAGIAGLRLGYAICHPELVGALMKIKQPYNVNAAAEAAGLAALSVADALNEQADQIIATRDDLIFALSEQPSLRPYRSEANFVLVRVAPLGEDARATASAGRQFHDALAQEGVFVRFYANRRLRNCVRISVPTPEQLPTLLERIERVLS